MMNTTLYRAPSLDGPHQRQQKHQHPGPNGEPAIPHASRVKVRLQSFQGWWVDRVPAWIQYATVPPNEMGAKYDGVYWNPPDGERHEW